MKILSPAKINLFLQITGKRIDGYHDLVTLLCCVGLYDTVSLVFGAKETTVDCVHPNVPEDKTNIAFGASSLFLKTLNKNEGVKISIEKNIPVAAGLGGGSSSGPQADDTRQRTRCGNASYERSEHRTSGPGQRQLSRY